MPCPERLAGLTLRESGIGERTGVTVVGVDVGDNLVTDPGPDTVLVRDSVLLVIGTEEQVRALRKLEAR